MLIQEVILRAASGELGWGEAAELLAMDVRSLLRWRKRYAEHGYDGLLDRRRQVPSAKRAPWSEVERILRLYRERYVGFNIQHFHEIARREHGVKLSYSFVKKALQGAGLVGKRKARGKHRRRRERRACFGELLHMDGSPHEWLALRPGEKQTLLTVIDDATSRMLYGQLWPAETTRAVMEGLRQVFEAHGLPLGLYTDRASWAFHTREGGGIDRENLTQVGRALAELGIEHIPAYSPQARGRSERANRTIQGRLVNELRVAGVRTLEAANAYLRSRFQGIWDQTFARAPADPASAFVPLLSANLDFILCHQEERAVGKDNTVVLDRVRMQIDKQPGRRSCAGLRVLVRRHLDRRHTVWLGTRLFGTYDSRGRPLANHRPTGRHSASGSALRSVAAASPASP
jgi:transposase